MLKYEQIETDVDVKAKIVSFKNEEIVTYFPMHFHKSSELLYCESGTLNIRVYDKEYILRAGDVVYINSNIPHETKSIEANHVYMIQMKTQFFDEENYYIELNSIENPKYKDTTDFEDLKNLIKEIYSTHRKKEAFYQYLVMSKIDLLKYMLLKGFLVEKHEQSNITTEGHLRLVEIMQYIDENFHYGITVSDIANHFEYALPYFSSMFKERSGITCTEYLQRRRLSKAMSLMKESKLSIIDVSFEVGFPNIKTLRRLFKNEFGITPSEFIHQNKRDK